MIVTISVHATQTYGGGRNARIALIDFVKSLGGKFTGGNYGQIFLEFDSQHTQAIADEIEKQGLPVANILKIE